MKNELTISVKFEFDAGHRLYGHEGKCAKVHGHRYVAVVTLQWPASQGFGLDSVGRILDFSIVKQKIGGWIDFNWDHKLLLKADDPLVQVLKDCGEGDGIYICPQNPTAEMMSYWLFWECASLLQDCFVEVVSVRIYETPNCWAEYTPSPGES